MKYLFLGILVGFLSHKVINYTYDYCYNAAFNGPKCHDIMTNGGNLHDRFVCTEQEMVYSKYLAYLLIRPAASNDPFKEESWIF